MFYEVGDVLHDRVTGRIVEITSRAENISGRGSAGWEGLTLPGRVQSVWGYDTDLRPAPPLYQLAAEAERG